MVSREKLEDYFYMGIFLIAMLFALIATVRLYFSIEELIVNWFDYRYRPVFQALFSVSVLAICIYIIRDRLIRR